MVGVFYAGNQSMEFGETTMRPLKDYEVAIEVAFCGICGTDIHIYNGNMDHRVEIPQVIGHEMSGVIIETGKNVNQWRKGDRVVVRPLDPCNECPACLAGNNHICYNLSFLGIETPGALQSVWIVPEYTLHRIPDGLAMKVAALTEPLSVACHDVRLGNVQPGDKVAVIGGGPIGMLISMVCAIEESDVVVIEVNANRVNLAKNLGFEAINPTTYDAQEWVKNWTNGAGADVVFEVSGSASGAMMMTDLVKARGQIVMVAIFTFTPEVNLFKILWREMKMCGARVYEPQDFDKALSLLCSKPDMFESIISKTINPKECPGIFRELSTGSEYMKILVDFQGGS
jgi:(R,R)-butanediol dehydrogenase/meso-butanediol dehydrogenase/diacetyl reductase